MINPYLSTARAGNDCWAGKWESQGKRSRVRVGEKHSGGSRDEELTQNFGICGWSCRRELKTWEKLLWDNQAVKQGNTCGTSRVRSSTLHKEYLNKDFPSP